MPDYIVTGLIELLEFIVLYNILRYDPSVSQIKNLHILW